jgi:hypothetical protein
MHRSAGNKAVFPLLDMFPIQNSICWNGSKKSFFETRYIDILFYGSFVKKETGGTHAGLRIFEAYPITQNTVS